jgi:hypothetical protein
MVELILIEITAVSAERSRGRHNPRVVKRKMSNFPTKSRAPAAPRHLFRYDEHIRIIAPVGLPEPNIPPLTTCSSDMTPTKAPRRRPGGAPATPRHRSTTARPGSTMSEPGAAAGCREPPTAIAIV